MALIFENTNQNGRELTHFQVMQSRLADVISTIEPGGKLPSEPQLAKQLGVSRATLREAMRTFEGQGIIRRRQGVGTFVVAPGSVIESGLEVLESIETLAEKMGLVVSMGELKIEHLTANQRYAEKLKVDIGTPIKIISRVIYSDNRPIAYLIDVLPKAILSDNELGTDFHGSVLDCLIASKSYALSNSETFIHAEPASSFVAKSLEIQRGDVLLLFEAFLYDENERILDYSFSYFLPGYFSFKVIRSVGLQP